MSRSLSLLIGSATVVFSVWTASVAAQDPKAELKEVKASGKLLPSESIWIYPSVDGIVREVHCSNGEVIRKGQSLLTVESIELKEKQARLKAELEFSKAKAQGLLQLPKEALSGADRANIRSQLENLRAESSVQEQQLAELEKLYNGGAIQSPADGTVVMALDEKWKGRYIKRDGPPLLKVTQLNGDWEVAVLVAESDVGRVLSALKGAADKKLDVELHVAAFPRRTFRGTLHLNDVGKEMSVVEEKPVLWARVRLTPESLKDLKILPIGVNVSVRVVCPETP